jgi:hypothetical protein
VSHSTDVGCISEETEVKKLLLAGTAVVALTTAANAGIYTYKCKVGSKSYPVTVTTPYEKNSDRPGVIPNLSGGTITWRGVRYPNVSATQEDCKVLFTAKSKDADIALCTATQGYAKLSITSGGPGSDGIEEYDCEMRGR